MSKELLDFLTTNGLPAWFAIMIGTGTVIAATIAGVVALVVAGINSRSARLLAKEAAHRTYRQSLTEPALTYSRKVGRFASQRRTLLKLEAVALRDAAEVLQWVTALESFSAEADAFISSDAGVQAAVDLLNQAAASLEVTLIPLAAGRAPTSRTECFDLLREHCDSIYFACATVELCVEAYIFNATASVPTARKQGTEQSLKTFDERRERVFGPAPPPTPTPKEMPGPTAHANLSGPQ
jgi:hypothetical protein